MTKFLCRIAELAELLGRTLDPSQTAGCHNGRYFYCRNINKLELISPIRLQVELNTREAIAEYDTLELASDSVKKCLEPLRPPSAKVNSGRSFADQGAKSYLERRRKHGLPSLKRVLQESNDSVNRVRRGASFFGLLNEETINKVTRFWTERKRFENQRRTQIMPPNRRHLLGHLATQTPSREASTTMSGVQTSQLTIQTADKSISQSLLLEEKRLEEEEAKEDALLVDEPEMIELTTNLLSTGWQPPNQIREIIAHMSPVPPGSRSNEPKGIHANQKVSSAVSRRRRRLRAQWLDEQPRPYTPIHLNICRPGLGHDLHVSEEKLRLTGLLSQQTLRSPVDHEKTGGRPTNAEDQFKGIGETSLRERLIEDILYSQLCCLHWLLEQMITGPKDSHISPIALPTAGVQRNRPESGSLTSSVPTADGPEKTISADQEWYQLICGVDRLVKLRARSRKGCVKLRIVGSFGNLSAEIRFGFCNAQVRILFIKAQFFYPEIPGTDRTDMSDQRTPSAKSIRRKTSAARSRLRPERKPSGDANESTHTTQSTSTPSSSLGGPTRRASMNAFQSEEESTSTTPLHLASGNSFGLELRQKTLTIEDDKDDGEELMTAVVENKKTDQTVIPGWISARDVRDRYSRVVLSEMAKQIELDLDKEIANERMEKLHRIHKQSILERPRTIDSVVTATSRPLKSAQWEKLPQTMRVQLTAMREQMSMELQDRLMYMRE
ncbi:unnamed protein product [Echinostoma caproni]|uniref:Uncharacterized protein n=1 Tax=Echinostoma caproni TaxID=27848 RepID=A0A183AAS4_9TREM|nr:unnamed protein product [Echinostoma caproni]